MQARVTLDHSVKQHPLFALLHQQGVQLELAALADCHFSLADACFVIFTINPATDFKAILEKTKMMQAHGSRNVLLLLEKKDQGLLHEFCDHVVGHVSVFFCFSIEECAARVRGYVEGAAKKKAQGAFFLKSADTKRGGLAERVLSPIMSSTDAEYMVDSFGTLQLISTASAEDITGKTPCSSHTAEKVAGFFGSEATK